MANEEQTGKSESELIERAWHVAAKAHTSTLVTIDGDKPVARPMSPKADPDTGIVFFLTQVDAPQPQSAGDIATVFFIEGNTYVSMTGSIVLSNDRAKIKGCADAHGRGDRRQTQGWRSREAVTLRSPR